jgi:alginate O-acetyltransferase complex protein AlgI
VNLTIVMLLGGLWHGANWTFLCWGAYHGLWLAGERMRGKRSWYDRLPAAARVACTWVLVLGSWVIFRAPTLTDAGRYFGWMSGLSGADATTALPAALFYAPASVVHMVVCLACVLAPVQAHDWVEHMHWGKVLLVLPLFAVTLMAMFAQSFSPFLYFQF